VCIELQSTGSDWNTTTADDDDDDDVEDIDDAVGPPVVKPGSSPLTTAAVTAAPAAVIDKPPIDKRQSSNSVEDCEVSKYNTVPHLVNAGLVKRSLCFHDIIFPFLIIFSNKSFSQKSKEYLESDIKHRSVSTFLEIL